MTNSSALTIAVYIALALVVALLATWVLSVRLFVKYPIHATLRVTTLSMSSLLIYLVTPHFSVEAQVDSVIDFGILSLRTAEPILLSNQLDPSSWIPGAGFMALLATIALLRVRQ